MPQFASSVVWELDAKRMGDLAFSGSATGNTILDAARGITPSGAAVNTEESRAEWTRLELCVIASLQLALVLVSYRLDRSEHPVLISESAVAIFFGVLVGQVAFERERMRWLLTVWILYLIV